MCKVTDALFNLTRALPNLPFQQKVKESFNKLHTDPTTQGGIGYFGRRQSRQFFGYLEIDNDFRTGKRELPFPIAPLSAECSANFRMAHSLICAVNRKCLSTLKSVLPGSICVVDPYQKDEFYDDQVQFEASIELAVQSLASQFEAAKFMNVIQSKLTAHSRLKGLSSDSIGGAVRSIRTKIGRFGLGSAPRDIFELTLRMNEGSEDAALGAILLSVICAAGALECIDQLLFQAFVQDRLSCLNEKNIFAVLGEHHNAVGHTFRIAHLNPVIWCGEIIVLERTWHKGSEAKSLCLVENTNMKHSQVAGTEFEAGMRVLDDCCCPYGSLLHTAQC